MSIVQENVAGMEGEIRDLRKDLEPLKQSCANFSAIYTPNTTPEHGKDFENEDRGLEVAKIYQNDGDTAGTFTHIGADFTVSSSAHDIHTQDRSETYGGTPVPTGSHSLNCDYPLVRFEPSPQNGTDAGILYITDGSDTAGYEHETSEQRLVGQEVRKENDMTNVLNESTFFADPDAVTSTPTTYDTRRCRRTEYQKGWGIITFPTGQLISDTAGDRRALAAHPRSRFSRRKKRTSIMGSKAGHRGGDRTASSMKEAVRIKKRLDKKREARLKSRELRNTRPSEHVEARIPEERSHGGVRLEQPTTDSDKEDAWPVEKSDGSIRDLGFDLGCFDPFDSPKSDLSSVESPHGDHICVGVSSTATRFEDDDESLGNLEVSKDFVEESQENNRNHTSSDALEAFDNPLISASEVTIVNAAEDSPSQDTSVSLATEEFETQAIDSRYKNNLSSKRLANDYKHTTSGKDETLIVVLEDREANSLGKSEATSVSSIQSRGQLWGSEKTDDIDHHTSYDKGYPIAAESKTSGDNDEKTSQVLPDSRLGQQVYGDLVALEERRGARASHHVLAEHTNAVPGEVKEKKSHEPLRAPEAREMNMEQPVREVTKLHILDNSETLISRDRHSHQMTSRSDDRSQRADVADISAVNSFGGVTNEAEESWQSDHLTSDWTTDPGSELGIPPVANLPKSNDSGQQVIGDEHSDSLDAGPRGDGPVATPPLASLVSDRDIAIAEVDSISSSTVDELNVSEVLHHIQEHIGAVQESMTKSKDGPQSRTSDLISLDDSPHASTSRSIEALLLRKSRKPEQQSAQEEIDHNVSPSDRRDVDKSAAPTLLREAMRSNHSTSSLPEETRGLKRSGAMPDRDDKDKRPRLLSDVETEIKTRYVSESGRTQDAVAVSKLSTCDHRRRIPTSLQDRKTFTSAFLFATVRQESDLVEGVDPKPRKYDVQNRDEPIARTTSRDERNLVEDNSIESTSMADHGPSPTTNIAKTDIASNNDAPAIEDMISDGVKRGEEFSLRQPVGAPSQGSRGRNRSREESDKLPERGKKVVRLTPCLEENVDAAGMRPHMAAPDDILHEKVMRSSGVGVKGSATLLDQKPETGSDHQHDEESDPWSSIQLDVTILRPAEIESKALFEQWKRKRKETKRTTRSAKQIVQRSREKRKYRVATRSLEDPVLVSLDDNSLRFPPGVTLGITPLPAAEEQRVEHLQFGTQIDISTDSKGHDEQRSPGSLPQEMITDQDETGVNIYENSLDRQDPRKSQAQSGATTDISADLIGHMNSQSYSTQASSDGHGRLQSLDAIDKEVIEPTRSSQASDHPSHSSTVTGSATDTVGSLTCEKSVRLGLEYDDDDIVGHVVEADYFSQTVAELEQ
jgi:hypothetical protein